MDLFSDNINIEDLNLAKRLFMESRAGLIKLFNNSPVCMSMTSPQRVYVRVNKKFKEKFGYTDEEVVGRNSIEVGILDQAESERVGRLIKEKGRLQNDYVKCIAKNGRIVHTVSSIELMEMNGEAYLVSFFVDITKIVEQQAVIEQHVEKLQEVNKDLEAFSYSVSHDLRAPLRAINGYARILEEDFQASLDAEGKRILSAVQHNARKMGNLIDDLLAFSKMGQKTIVKGDINMNAIVNEVLSDLKKNSDHKTQVNVATLLPCKGDQSLIMQVMINLISNGIKYSSKKEQPVVDITSELKDGMIRYTVKDNGDGFDMKYAGKLFGVFQRLHSERDFEGTGVGLAIVKRIVNRHGGTISAQAEPGKGAAFTFTLPAE